MTEHQPQPEQSLYDEAQSYETFNDWLRSIPDGSLQRVVNSINRIDQGMRDSEMEVDDATKYDEFDTLQIMLHYADITVDSPDQNKAVLFFKMAHQVEVESRRRNEELQTDSIYTLIGKVSIQASLTDKGWERHGTN